MGFVLARQRLRLLCVFVVKTFDVHTLLLARTVPLSKAGKATQAQSVMSSKAGKERKAQPVLLSKAGKATNQAKARTTTHGKATNLAKAKMAKHGKARQPADEANLGRHRHTQHTLTSLVSFAAAMDGQENRAVSAV